MTSLLECPDVLDPDYIPTDLVNRDEELVALTDSIRDNGSQHLFLYGPRGVGKTLLTRHALDTDPATVETCILSCMNQDTQYKVLARLVEQLQGKEVGSGYHTAQLQDQVATQFPDTDLVLVLDDVDFLLANDGNDLLYYLSRLDHDDLTVVGISAHYSDLAAVVDERTYSSLHPRHFHIEPYTIHETYQILEDRTRTAFTRQSRLPKEALSIIAANTPNITLGLFWLYETATAATDTLAVELVHETRTAALQRYREHLLADFSAHHRLLCDVIEDLTADADYVHTGAIYDQYEQLCRSKGHDPLTTRRLSDYLKDLELLGIIQADYYYGGKEGKTREIKLNRV